MSTQMHNNFARILRYDGGGVLVLVLVVVSAMTLLSFGLAYRTRIEIRLAGDYARRTQCHYLAIGGIERAKAELTSTNLSEQNITALTRFSTDAAAENLFQSLTLDEMFKKAQIQYCIEDEFGYFNLNASDPAAWQKLGFSRAICAGVPIVKLKGKSRTI